METQIEKLAKAMLSERLRVEIEEADRALEIKRNYEAAVIESFKEAFADVIPSLEEAGITFSAHLKAAYHHQGTYIMFQRGENTLYMDYNGPVSYRYEYTKVGEIGRIAYGKWGLEEFILWIYLKLFKSDN